MNDIIYRQADYCSPNDKRQIIELYKTVFKNDFSSEYEFWFKPGLQRNPIGVVAVCVENGRIIGHFTTIPFESLIDEKLVNLRLSMGFMTDPGFRGRGIGVNLYANLAKRIKEAGDASFIVGFPNNVSFEMHVRKMNYQLLREYHFVTLPRTKHNSSFRKINEITELHCRDVAGQNRLCHTAEYLNRRFSKETYRIYVSDNEKIFIVTKFNNKVDILYWSGDASESELLDFAEFVYRTFEVDKVTTWDSMEYLKKYPKEKRVYHMCVNFLNCKESMKYSVMKEWMFYMGDCELF